MKCLVVLEIWHYVQTTSVAIMLPWCWTCALQVCRNMILFAWSCFTVKACNGNSCMGFSLFISKRKDFWWNIYILLTCMPWVHAESAQEVLILTFACFCSEGELLCFWDYVISFKLFFTTKFFFKNPSKSMTWRKLFFGTSQCLLGANIISKLYVVLELDEKII